MVQFEPCGVAVLSGLMNQSRFPSQKQQTRLSGVPALQPSAKLLLEGEATSLFRDLAIKTHQVELYSKQKQDNGKTIEPEFRRSRRSGARAVGPVPRGGFMLAVSARGKVAAEDGVSSLSVPVLSVALWSQGDTYRGEGSDQEEGRWRQRPFFLRGDVVCADQRRAPTAFPSGVVGAGGVFVVRSLRELIDGRQLMAMRVILVIIIQAYESVIRCLIANYFSSPL